MSGCLKPDTVPGNGVFHTLDLEKAFGTRGALFVPLEESLKEYFVSGCFKPDKVPGNGEFHTLNLGGKSLPDPPP